MTESVHSPDVSDEFVPVILQGHVSRCLDALPPDSVNVVVTSSPYYGVRHYGTKPQLWGGTVGCHHEWKPTAPRRTRTANDRGRTSQVRARGEDYDMPGGDLCTHCGGWLGELGNEPDPDLFTEHLVFDVMRRVQRVLRPDGVVFLVIADTYNNRHGFHRADARWSRPNKSAGQSKPRIAGLPAKTLLGVPARVELALLSDGWTVRSMIVWSKPNPKPETADDRLSRSHEIVYMLTKHRRYHWNRKAERIPYSPSTLREMDETYVGTATKRYRGTGAEDPSEVKRRIIGRLKERGGANPRTVWSIKVKAFRGAHFATFPEELVEKCLNLAAFDGCLVLDPFAGSGTTLAVARRKRCHSIGIELNPAYVKIAKQRAGAQVERIA